MIFSECAVVVMDVGSPKMIKSYKHEKETNDLFVRYLNSRLWKLKSKKVKIIESNYLEKTHPLLTINYDLSTRNIEEIIKFIQKEKIKKVVYVGFHYGRCTHVARETSGIKLLKRAKDFKVYVSPFLCRPLAADYLREPIAWEPKLPIINL